MGYISHVLLSPPSMCVKDSLSERTCLEQREAKQHRVAHARPNRRADVLIDNHVLYKYGVDCHAYDNEKALKRQCQQSFADSFDPSVPIRG